MARLISLCLASLLAAAAILMAGCNTVDGLGKDIEGTGEAIQNVSGR